MSDSARRYATRTNKSVLGWLHPIDAELIHRLGRAQEEHRVAGSVGEVGVHHGKLFILLQLLSRAEEKAFAVDIFGNQHLNVDRSGHGQLATFFRNVAKYGAGTERVTVIARPSQEVTPKEILVPCGPARLFSIDGGHTASLTLSDLWLADSCIAEGGIVFLDDVFNSSWPGVYEGAVRYLDTGSGRLVPFAIGVNKVMLTTESHRDRYLADLEDAFRQYQIKQTEFMGRSVTLFGVVPPRERLRRSALWRCLRETPVGRLVRSLLRQ